ncbi:MAG: thioredoxin-disulfide reductase [Pseudoflavonifractor capillosus]|uniref:thioredoxin-disulfide reductase n=1 Tax=Pseudoflavonifractor capillosus TaxID=106588 RepID=UPI0023F63791|nr:thioredoxin-disulfide reductase [Pseudoflavonifractor capillosus]MCI5927119.1 thioredoxin-disulfide reductase [Pseudoflavonifractor capillosus]MDY4661867.1 thioredoxin-disulfide reductase [Pseudoflavonifractor capillosus]
MYDIIIIGAGPAGLTAAIYAKRAGYSALLLEGGTPGGQAATTPDIENWPGSKQVSGPDFAMNLYEQAQALGTDIRFERVASLADNGTHKTVTTGGNTYEGRTVIIANGVRRRKLEVPGEERLAGRGVSYCATCDGNFFRGRDTAVVGGGNTALEDALFLANICPNVYLVHRRDTFKAERHLIDALAAAPNIHVLLSHKVVEVQGEQAVTSLLVEGPDGRRSLPVAGVFAAVGLAPDNQVFSPPLELNEAGYIIAGEDTRTNVPGIFAAGDTRVKDLRQLVTAAADGASAASQAGRYLQSAQ